MDSFVSSIVSWTHRRRAVVVVALLCWTLVSLAGVRRMSFRTESIVTTLLLAAASILVRAVLPARNPR